MTDFDKALSDITAMDEVAKMEYFITAAKLACQQLSDTTDTYNECNNALDKCSLWLNGKGVEPQEISHYLDAPDSEIPYMDEDQFAEDSDEQCSLIFITMIVGYIANRAYIASNRESDMSEIICEADESLITDIIEYGLRLNVLQ